MLDVEITKVYGADEAVMADGSDATRLGAADGSREHKWRKYPFLIVCGQ
jgi:hypothetical protein